MSLIITATGRIVDIRPKKKDEGRETTKMFRWQPYEIPPRGNTTILRKKNEEKKAPGVGEKGGRIGSPKRCESTRKCEWRTKAKDVEFSHPIRS